jgi:predicted aspartyl protease
MRRGHVGASIAVIALLRSVVPLAVSPPPVDAKTRSPQADAATRPGDVPFDLVQRHLIVVKGSAAELHELNLLIDTGTIPSVLDRRIARKLRLTVEPSQVVAFGQTLRIDRATLPDLHIGSYAVGTVPAAVGDLSYLDGTRIDVILGLDVLARTSFSIDYSARQLSFAPSARESAVAPLRIVWPFVTVRLSVAGHPTQLLVDTGSPDLVLFKSRMAQALLPMPWKGEKVVQHASGSARLLRFDLNHVIVGDEHWDKLPGFVLDASTNGYPPDVDGVLGVLALGGTRVHFDFQRGELGWSR